MRWVSALSDRIFDGIVRRDRARRRIAQVAAVGVAGVLAAGAIHHYVVRPGDTLSGIAQSVCGNGSGWTSIYQQNKVVVGGNPNLIYVGQKLAFNCSAAATESALTTNSTADTAHAAVVTPVVSGSSVTNLVTIARFLENHGYSRSAAAGIAGDIEGESAGNPESEGMGGGGIIGWTPLPAGYVTGNPSADLATQLGALLIYNEGWGQYIGMLNAASGPVAAGNIYSQYFERPAQLYSDTRPSMAELVYSLL